ncbi:MAG: TonB-dependent receptor plug domain-containing protein [Gemmatimonadales bacterium]
MRRIVPRRELLAAAAALVLASVPVHAQVTPPGSAAKAAAPAVRFFRGRLVGVFDEATGDPLDSVEVRDVLSGLSAFTTKTGTLSLFFVDTAGSMIRFRKPGYVPLTMLVQNSFRDTIPLTITLAHAGGQVLPTVVTTDSGPKYRSALLRGFDERRREGYGHVVTEAELRKSDDRALADVLVSHMPGISIVRVGSATYLTTHREARVCYPAVFLDGVMMSGLSNLSRRSVSAVDLSQFDVNFLAGVEYYSVGTVPAQYNSTAAGCGVLLLWTRER